MSEDVSHLWVGFVNIYSRCRLTFDEDKLYDFLGVIELFQELAGDVYLAGAWQSKLLHHLAWVVTKPAPKSAANHIKFYVQVMDSKTTMVGDDGMADAS
ncbi:heterokaryon incompatibility protein [Colletotrichum tabaci]|uniref:Heterokaryon incompatibility protein n=1 Tax=Colletotrichum tabaci TaxID=1209068 RepID=A0AAV9SVC4_9PEZI